jgi:hypothetical protein
MDTVGGATMMSGNGSRNCNNSMKERRLDGIIAYCILKGIRLLLKFGHIVIVVVVQFVSDQI